MLNRVLLGSSQNFDADFEFLASLQQQSVPQSSSGIVAEAASYLDFGFFGGAAALLTPVKQSLESNFPTAASSIQAPFSSSKLSPAAISFLRSLPDLSYMLSVPSDLDARE